MVARSINAGRVVLLTGSAADLESDDYVRIKNQLMLVRTANPRCRFLYLMRVRPDGAVLIMVDSEPPDSEDYSPPGQVYDEASEDIRALFVDKKEAVHGPFSDRWGTWISAFIPLTDQETGGLAAVFGMDIDARAWWRQVVLRALLPAALAALVLLLLLLVVNYTASNRAIRKAHEERELLLRRMSDAFVLFESIFDERGRLSGGRFVYVNDAYERIMGMHQSQVLGKTVHEVWPGTEPSWMEACDKVVASGESAEFDMFHAPTGRLYHCSAYRPGATRERFCLIFEDITERRKAEDEVRAALARFETVIQSTPMVAIEGFDSDGTIRHWNRAAELIYGYSAREAVGRKAQDLLQEDPATGRQHVTASVWSTGQATGPQEWRIKTRFGVSRWVYSSMFPVFSGDRVIEVFCMDVDITDRMEAEGQVRLLLQESDRARAALLSMLEDVRQAEDKVRRLNEELEQRVRDRTAELEAANKELEAFSYSVSHDLRGPLRIIAGYSQTVIEDHGDRLDGEGRKDLERIYGAAQKMSLLIDDLLTLSRIARREMKRERVDLTALAEDVVNEIRKSDPHHTVEVVIAEGLSATGDASLLRVAIQNLLGNAWKFTCRTPNARIEVGRDAAGAFFVRDNGAGFDMQYADKLFKPFQRLHDDAEFEGTGIGLATVHRIIQRHGGRIWAEGAVGQGATFFLTL